MIETYIPLYRKYRPQDFNSLMGQEALAQTLGNAITLGKVAHAYLFTGPRGTGKTSTARILAKSLNCEQGPTLTPCQVCASCTGITNGNALDVIEFDAASNNGVEQARELIESTRMAPLGGRFKIYIIDEVHMLTPSSFNALLKTLEEPPPNVVFIFATTEAHKVLPTIVSRCQRFDLQRINTQAIVDRLAWVCDQETLPAEPEALTQIARHARGGLRDALSLLDQVGVLARAKPNPLVTRDEVRQFIGALDDEALLHLVDALAGADTAALMTQLNRWMAQGMEPGRVVKSLLAHVRHLMVVKSCQGPAHAEWLDLPAPYVAALQAQAQHFGVEELPQILHTLAQLDTDIRRGTDPQLTLEVGLLGLAYREKIFSVDRLMARIEALESRLGSGGSVAPLAPSQPAPAYSASQTVQAPPPAPASYGPPLPPPVMMSPPVAAAGPPLPPSISAPPPLGPPLPPSMSAPLPPSVQPVASSPVPLAPAAASFSTPMPVGVGSGDQAMEALKMALLSRISGMGARSLLKENLWIAEVDDHRLVFGCAAEGFMKQASTPAKIVEYEQAAIAHFGSPRTVSFRVEKKKPESGLNAPTLAPVPIATPVSSSPPPVAMAPVSGPAPSPETTRPGPIEIDPTTMFLDPPSSPPPPKAVGVPIPQPAPVSERSDSWGGPSGMPPAIGAANRGAGQAPPPLPPLPPFNPAPYNPLMEAPLMEEGNPYEEPWDPDSDDDDRLLAEDGPSNDEPLLVLTGDPAWQETKSALLRLLQGKLLE
jgi:DNA polymerase III subunit gamma/tau